MNRIEDFINSLDTSGIAPGDEAGNLTLDKWFEMRKRLLATLSAAEVNELETPSIKFDIHKYGVGAQDDASEAARRLVASDYLMRRRLIQLKPDVYSVIGASFVGSMNSEAVYAAYLDEYRAKYGDQWVNDAIQLARTSGYSVAEAITAKEAQELAHKALEVFSEAAQRLAAQFADIGKTLNERLALGDKLARGFADVPGGASTASDGNDWLSTPANRHERRASKHRVKVKDGDQQWRNRSKYRNRR